MRNRLYLLVTVALLLLPVAPGPLVFPTRATAGARSRADKKADSSAQKLAESQGLVTAIFELQSDCVIVHEASGHPPEAAGRRLELQSSESIQYEARLRNEQKDFESSAATTSSDIRVLAELRKVANAVAIQAPAATISLISSLPAVKKVELSKRYHAVLDKSVPLIGAPGAWSMVGGGPSAGNGVKIAILDTGIDIGNPLFADAGFTAPPGFPLGDSSLTNNKVIVAKSFVSGDASAADQDGHGTNVAGIAAGDLNTPTPLGPISGVAPAAFLGNYRVLDASGSGMDFLIAQALEAAISDGFDIASLSLGAPAGSQLSVLDTSVENAVAAGMVVVVAAGNDGDGQMTIDSPGIAPHAITVAASSNSHLIASTVGVVAPAPVPSDLENIESTDGQTCSVTFPPVIGPLPYVDEATLDKKKRACKARRLAPGSMTGQIALIERGICNFSDKINNAAAAGAVGAIIYNKDLSEGADGGDNIIFMDVTGTSIPSVFIARSKGLAMRAWIASHPGAQATIHTTAVEFSDSGDILASFSSRGPTSLGALKPDLAAPGVNIYSGAITACNADGVSDPSGFVAVSGTSQATPHVTGSAALVKQLHHDWTPDQIKSALVNSADGPVFASTDPGPMAGVLDVGGGRLDVANAASIDALFGPSSIGFGINKTHQTINLTANLTMTSEVDGQNSFSISVSQTNADPGLTISTSSSSVSLTKGAGSTLTITLNAAKSTARGDHTGYIVVTGPSGKPMKIPFWIRL